MDQLEITQLGRNYQDRYRTDPSSLLQENNCSQQIRGSLLRELSSNETNARKIVPIREYSNKFLRESGSKENQDKGKIGRLNSVVHKHKNFQKKYQKILCKKNQICKT
jgi:hypothetical protein